MIDNNQMPLPDGYQLKRYKILEKLNKGGFGIAYLALDTKENRPVVIKEYFPDFLAHRTSQQTQVSVLSAEKSDDYQQGLRRFEREALVLGEFNQPNIVKVLGYFKDNNTAYFVMDYIDGLSLKEYQESKNRSLTEQEIIQQCLPVLKGLAEVHKKGLLHLDIKPDNILKTKHGEPMLIDFGGARFSTGKASQEHSSMVATKGYAPPEQNTRTAEQSAATDLYSFGMTLYKLMAPTAILPLSQDRQTALVEETPDPLKPIRNIAKGYSETLYEAVETCTQIRQSLRPQSVEALQSIFSALKQQTSTNDGAIDLQDQEHRYSPSISRSSHNSETAKSSEKPFKSILITVLLFGLIGGSYQYNQYQQQLEDEDLAGQKTLEAERIEEETRLAEAKRVQEEAKRIAEQSRIAKALAEQKKLEVERIATAKRLQEEKILVSQNKPNNIFEQAQRAYREQNYSLALRLYKKAGNLGHGTAMYKVARMFYFGEGTTKSIEQAITWLRLGVSNNDMFSENMLGAFYLDGIGVNKDYEAALKLLTKASEQGDVNAPYNIAGIYKMGKGVEKSPIKSFKFFLKSAELGHATAQASAGYAYYQGWGTNKNNEKAFLWVNKSALQGDSLGQNNLAFFYEKGIGVPRDMNNSMELYLLAAEQNNLLAQMNLAKLYANGTKVDKDFTKSLYWYRKVALGKSEYSQEAKDSIKRICEQERALCVQLSEVEASVINQSGNPLEAEQNSAITQVHRGWFDADSFAVKSRNYAPIMVYVKKLSEQPNSTLRIKGYTDSKGNRSYNLALAERRAKAVKQAFYAEGIAAERIEAISYGEDDPVASNETEEGRALNRRIEIDFFPNGHEFWNL